MDGLGDLLDGTLAEVDWGERVRSNECGGSAIIARGIVLVDGLDGDAIGGGADGFGKLGAPVEVGIATDAKPVDCTEDDGLLAVRIEDDSFGEER